jgi:photosystem II stability/assembly factor-like uncharacterized protein
MRIDKHGWRPEVQLIAAIAGVLCALVTARSPADQLVALPDPNLLSIHMIDRQTGWAESNTEVLRTADGGKSWTPVLSFPQDDDFESVFEDSTSALVTSVNADDSPYTVTLFQTSDGGRHWSSQDFTQQLFLLSGCLTQPGDNGTWLMLIPDHTMNSSPGVLYRRRDGCASWREVNSVDQSLPYGGQVVFYGRSKGWLLGSMESTSSNLLSITRDGGRSWALQQLPLPRELPGGEAHASSLPSFFPPDEKNGIMTATIEPATDPITGDPVNDYYVATYLTRDAGRTWKPTTPIAEHGWGCVWDIVSINQGWIWIPQQVEGEYKVHRTAKGMLCRTDDGGRTWLPIKGGDGLLRYLDHGQDVRQLDFVDRECGWALTASTDSGDRRLLHTADGGETWNALN